jgi:hypothetical protein
MDLKYNVYGSNMHTETSENYLQKGSGLFQAMVGGHML